MIANNFREISSNYNTSFVHKQGASLNIIGDIIPNSSNLIIGDLGCGAGHLGSKIAQSESNIYFIDPLQEMLDLAKQNYRNNSKSYFIKSNAEEIPQLQNDLFDIVGSRFAFHHFINPIKVFSEVKRLLKKKGFFFIIDLEGQSCVSKSSINHTIELLHDETHIKSWTIKELETIGERFEFKLSTYVSNLKETREGIKIEDWCSLTNRKENINAIENILDNMNKEELTELGYSKAGNSFVNHIRTQILVFQK